MTCSPQPLAHWPLHSDIQDCSPLRHDTQFTEVALGFSGPHGQPNTAARFNGSTSFLQIADHPALRFGQNEFTFAAWIYTNENTDVIGDLCSRFDATTRNGFHLSVLTNSGVTSTAQPNYRQLHFGVDDARHDKGWTDCGRPGNAVLIAALATVNGVLYAGTLETGANEIGHLWRYEGGQKWTDLGNPLGCNVAHSIAQYQGSVYCGFGRYLTRLTSNLPEELNKTPGGQVFRLEANGHWTDCGHPGHEDATPESVPTSITASGKADDVFALTAFNGNLYCVSNHRRGVFRYAGGQEWECVGLTEHRIISLTIYRKHLYALINGDSIYRYVDGKEWELCAKLPGASQLHGAVTCNGQLHVGTWPECDVFRYDGESWVKVGRIGYEREVMAMAYYNGKAYMGTLPMANVWRMDDDKFTYLSTLDDSHVSLRRVWSMAVYNGKLYAGTLPGGHVKSLEAGKVATWDTAFPSGWHHIAAVKTPNHLELYVDGECRARSSSFNAQKYSLSNDTPLTIGCGPYQHFDGLMSDVRLYGRALTSSEIAQLSQTQNNENNGR